MLRLAFFGSPAFALPTINKLYNQHELVLIVTQPDKPAGRGHKLTPPPVALRAKELGVKLKQPTKLRKDLQFAKFLESIELDVAITAAYGKILPKHLLNIPKYGFLNIHASLLPKYRGAAPIQWALINGEAETGITIMRTDVGMDTGDTILVEKLPIASQDNALTLFETLAELGSETLLNALGKLEAGQLTFEKQNNAEASHAPLLTKEDGRVRWNESATNIYNRYRGVYAWPGSFTIFNGKPLKVKELLPAIGESKAGTIINIDVNGVTVATGEGAILLKKIQSSGKKIMPVGDWVNGYQVKIGQSFR